MFDLGNKNIWQKTLSREKDYTNEPPKKKKNTNQTLLKIYTNLTMTENG